MNINLLIQRTKIIHLSTRIQPTKTKGCSDCSTLAGDFSSFFADGTEGVFGGD
ncbi:hypothetical protein DPMN_113592 [Dreissena polymorpha]|uniref:Uncharacterized protein n=1 Tax=Dreissena polymorpha TaxID=45954 RepID=A0A9D4QR53_DREPO|nr:hypothetical protein DPMN_113592 [Dreissena polymorpha]